MTGKTYTDPWQSCKKSGLHTGWEQNANDSSSDGPTTDITLSFITNNPNKNPTGLLGLLGLMSVAVSCRVFRVGH